MDYEINAEDVEKLIADLQNKQTGLEEIIAPIRERNNLDSKEELEELCQIEKFILTINYDVDLTTNSDFKILDKPHPPSPDFIISYNNKLIGLEHTRVLSSDADKFFKVEKLLRYAEKEFKRKYPYINVSADISIKNDELNYKQSEKQQLAEKIADAIQSKINGTESSLPQFITRLNISSHSQVSFSYKENNWQASYLSKERMKEDVRKKEKKIVGYEQSEAQLSEYWLVLVIGSLSSVSYELNESIDYSIESKFDRVYLMADFESKVIRVA